MKTPEFVGSQDVNNDEMALLAIVTNGKPFVLLTVEGVSAADKTIAVGMLSNEPVDHNYEGTRAILEAALAGIPQFQENDDKELPPGFLDRFKN